MMLLKVTVVLVIRNCLLSLVFNSELKHKDVGTLLEKLYPYLYTFYGAQESIPPGWKSISGLL